jgi:hypothetical protein
VFICRAWKRKPETLRCYSCGERVPVYDHEGDDVKFWTIDCECCGYSYVAPVDGERATHLPAVTVGYHGLPRADLDSVMSEGLLRAKSARLGQNCQSGGCLSLAETPEVAATFGDVILEVQLDGLEGVSEFHGLEARVHADIPPGKLSVHEDEVIPSREGFIDPAKTPLGNHPACCFSWRLEGFGLRGLQGWPVLMDI